MRVRRRDAGDRPGGRLEPGREALSVAQQDGASNTNIGVRVLNWGDNGSVRADEQRRVRRDCREPERDGPGRRPGRPVARARRRSGRRRTATRKPQRSIGRRAVRRREHECLRSCSQPGGRRLGPPVEHRRLVGDGGQPEPARAGRGSGSGRLRRHAGDRPGGEVGSGRGALSLRKQYGASNTNIPVRVLSKGDNGTRQQSNSVDSSSHRSEPERDEAGRGSGSGRQGRRAATAAASRRSARRPSRTRTRRPSRRRSSPGRPTRTPRCVGSKGDDGSVSQSNSVDSDATALNVNLTKQDADQDQGGSKDPAARGRHPGHRPGGEVDQDATAASLAAQTGGRDKCGCPSGGNTKPAGAGRQQGRRRTRRPEQLGRLGCDRCQPERAEAGCGSGSVGRPAASRRSGRRRRTSRRREPCRSRCSTVRATRTPRCGWTARATTAVTQSNSVDSDATAANLNLTKQDADQDQDGKGKVWLRRWRHPGDRPGGQERAGRGRPSRLRCSSGRRTTTLRCGSTARATTVLSVSRTASIRMRRLRT